MAHPRSMTLKQEAEAIRMYVEEGVGTDIISDRMGVGKGSVHRACQRAGVIRSRAEAYALTVGKAKTPRPERVKVPKDAPKCRVCGQVLAACPGEGGLCGDCVAEGDRQYAEEDVVSNLVCRTARGDITPLAAMLADELPEGASVVWKNPAAMTGWVAEAVCPYCRIIVWADTKANKSGESIDGATFCPWCCGECGTEPGPCRETAFRQYVERRVREWRVYGAQDAAIAYRRMLMEHERGVMLPIAEVVMR